MDVLELWRFLLVIVSIVCIVTLLNRFRKNRDEWNAKTRDYWFSFIMWSLAGLSVGVEGIIRHSSFGVRLVFISAASIVTLIGLRRKGSWGTENDR